MGRCEAGEKMRHDDIDQLRDPDLKLDRLRMWVHGRQYPDAQDYWDANWLYVTVRCAAPGASVSATGSFIQLPELKRWRDETDILLKTLHGEAKLDCFEHSLAVSLKAKSLGHITMEVDITPDEDAQRHWFQFEIDQTYLGPLLRDCNSILDAYPIRGL
jgi:hypothetical protein